VAAVQVKNGHVVENSVVADLVAKKRYGQIWYALLVGHGHYCSRFAGDHHKARYRVPCVCDFYALNVNVLLFQKFQKRSPVQVIPNVRQEFGDHSKTTYLDRSVRSIPPTTDNLTACNLLRIREREVVQDYRIVQHIDP
jgi:hypothetical protein